MVTKETFIKHFLPKIPIENRKLAEEIFIDYGESFYNDVAMVMITALENKKITMCLERLKEIYEEKVRDTAVEIRPTIAYMVNIEYFSVLKKDLAA